jgi:glycerol-3-phosphate dehydrogenase
LGRYAISAPERARRLDDLERESFDLVVIGGGISGAGIAQEASLRGASVALLESNDFASGTSSKSSKLIHGGLRYLAMGDFGLVRETALERKAIRRLAPHLAEPRWMVIPTRSRAGMLKLRAAVETYERLGAVESGDRHRNWGRRTLQREEPVIDASVYRFACAYREYLTDDARLVLANLRGAVAFGAVALGHAPVDRIVVEGGRAAGVEAECRLSGRRVRVRARAVINAAGPWVEPVRRLEDTSASPLLVLSKGIHLSIRPERLPVRNMIILNAQDGRGVFAIRRGPVVYVGTTDTRYEPGETHWPEITSADVEYLLEPLPRYFAIEPVKPEEAVAAWAGLRPLVAEPGKRGQKTTEISRRDEVLVGPARVVTVAGGKLTGYRPTARRAVEDAARISDLRLAPPPEDPPPLPGGDFDGDLERLAGDLRESSGVPEATAERLARLYGTEAIQVVALGAEPLVPGADLVRGEVDWAVAEEGAERVADVVYRRTRAAYYDPDARNRAAQPVAERMAELFGWDDRRREAEIDDVRTLLEAELGFTGRSGPAKA